MAPAPEPHTSTEHRATPADVAASRTTTSGAAATDRDNTSAGKPADTRPEWLADGMHFSGAATPRKESWLEWVFRSG